jgi:DNA-binding CsgD family transcriptional regulator
MVMDYEFYTDPLTGEVMVRKIGEPVVTQLTQDNQEIISAILSDSETFYPEQYKALTKEYSRSSLNKKYFDFLMARRIINCCYGENDSQPDIDEFGNRHFERVKCPRIAECKNYQIICLPKFSSELSEREKEVMGMYFHHVSTEDIADRLFLSIHTVKNHRKNSLSKLHLHSLEEFQDFAHRTKMFK